jgi:hypothetical protein
VLSRELQQRFWWLWIMDLRLLAVLAAIVLLFSVPAVLHVDKSRSQHRQGIYDFGVRIEVRVPALPFQIDVTKRGTDETLQVRQLPLRE